MNNSRWECPLCGSKEVQISLPGWYTESIDLELTHVECDSEAEVMAWYCDACGEGDHGQPDRLDE